MNSINASQLVAESANQIQTKRSPVPRSLSLTLGVVLNFWIYFVLWGFSQAINTDSLRMHRLLAGMLIVVAISALVPVLCRAVGKPVLFVFTFLLLLFPIWTLFFIVAEWFYEQSASAQL